MKRIIWASLGVLGVTIWGFGGRGNLGLPDQWSIFPIGTPWPLRAWGLPLMVLFLFGGAALLSVYDRFKRAKTRSEQKNSVVVALICLGILGFIWPWTLLGPGGLTRINEPASSIARTTLEGRFNVLASAWSDVATEYFGTAYTLTDAREFCRTYAQTRQRPTTRALAHVATHPPGATLWFYGARRFVEIVPGLNQSLNSLASQLTQTDEATLFSLLNQARGAASGSGRVAVAPLPRSAIGGALFCAILMGLSLVIALPAVYGLATTGSEKESLDSREARGVFACALWILAPCLNLYAFSLDAVIADGAAWTLFFAARAISTGNRRCALATGLALALTTMLSFGALTLGVVILLATFFARTSRPVLLELLGLAVGAFVLAWIAAGVWGGFNPLVVMNQATAAHHFATLSVRPYWPWVVLNGVVWAIFAGLPLVISLQEAARTRKELIIRSGSRKEAMAISIGMAFALGTVSTLVPLSFSGQVRGEVERLWLFLLAPLVAPVLVQNRKHAAIMAILQAVQTLVMAATIAPLVRPF